MKKLLLTFVITSLLISCEEKKEISTVHKVNWADHEAVLNFTDSAILGKTYLSVYSQIYSQTEHKTLNLTATVSMRNTNASDTLFVTKAEYFNTHGKLIRSYIEKPIFIAPMETIEIVINELDEEGGTGANFMFDWQMKATSYEPLFEAIMISTSGQQGISFTTQGKNIK